MVRGGEFLLNALRAIKDLALHEICKSYLWDGNDYEKIVVCCFNVRISATAVLVC